MDDGWSEQESVGAFEQNCAEDSGCGATDEQNAALESFAGGCGDSSAGVVCAARERIAAGSCGPWTADSFDCGWDEGGRWSSIADGGVRLSTACLANCL